jgi:Leucine-rich repeat (LRR) protein
MEEDFVAASLTTQFLVFPEVDQGNASLFSSFPGSCYNVLPSILSLTSCGHELEGMQNVFSRCVKLRKLDVEGCHLSSAMDELLHLSKLVNLHLKRCKISALHEQFSTKFQVVRYLEVSFANLARIPSDINLCGQLEDVVLNDNCIDIIPDSLFNLRNLKALILTGNRISEISANVGKLQALVVLMLSHNCIFELPVSIGYLTRLKHLQVAPNHCHPDTNPHKFRNISLVQRPLPSIPIQYPPSEVATAQWRVLHQYCQVVLEVKNSRFLEMPDMSLSTIGQDLLVFTTITGMNLKGNRLADLPAEVALMQSLTFMDLSKNALLQFPAAISNAKSLVELNVSGNNIVEVPVWICNLDGLKNLDLSRNALRTLPLEIAHCKSLTIIDMNPNLWTWLPQSIVDRGFAFIRTYYSKLITSNTGRLDLKNMELQHVSQQVYFECFRLIFEIDFSGNSLTEISDDFSLFSKARTVNFSSNKLTIIPKPLLTLECLTELDLSCNQFSAVLPEIAKLASLKFLSFKSNIIRTIDPSISFSQQLVSLDLSSNRISRLTDVFFHGMFQLASLFLQNNRFEIFPPEVFSATSLTELNLAVNPFTILPPQLIVFKNIVLILDLQNITQPSQTVCSQGLNAIFQWIIVLNSTERSGSSTLDLTAFGLTDLPPELLTNSSMNEIILTGNSIQTLPKECVSALSHLRILNYSMNALHDIPETLFGLTNLEQLNLSCNNITVVSDCISLLANLKLLNLVGNNISQIPFVIGSLPFLNHLLLNVDAITSPPRVVTKLGEEFILSFLKLLYFCSKSHALLMPAVGIEEWIPDILNFASFLTALSVLSNSFFELDFAVCDFTNLIHFDGSCNKISRIDQLQLLTKLEHLNLSNNLLQSPRGLFDAVNLKTLLVSFNLISEFPEHIPSILIEHLDMSHNPLSEISIKLLSCTKLRHFNVSNSAVSIIPDVIYLMESLTEMILSGVTLRSPPPEVVLAGFMPIKKYSEILYHGRMQDSIDLSKMSLKNIPEEIYHMSHLTELNLNENFFSGEFPAKLLDSLPLLQSFHLKGHKYTFPPKEIFDTNDATVMRRFYGDFGGEPGQTKLKLVHYFLVKMPPQANAMALTSLDLSDNLLSSLGISPISDMISTLTKLNLFGNKFTEVPAVIFRLSYLTSLNLGTNSIRSLNGHYQNLKNLKYLTVSNNNLSTVDRSLMVLDSLNLLDVSGHRFDAYPDVLSSLKSLQKASLDITNFTELRRLGLDQNVTFPPTHVLKGGMEKLIDLCKRFRDAKASNFMNLSGMGLLEIMDETFRFQRLKDVDISHNSIAILKPELCQLTEIVHLNLSHNRFSIIPAQIVELKLLEVLNCAHNRISHFPESLGGIETLAELTLVGNPLESPSAILAEKPFAIIKDYFMQLYKARTTRALNLRGKFLLEFHLEWEEQMMHMALQSIDLHNNILTAIPPQISAFCSHSLVELQLDYNQLNNNIWDIVKDLVLLTHFSSSHNILSSVPDEVSGLTSLKFLNLSFNHIRELSESFSCLKKLSALYLQSNLLTHIPFSFDGFENLAELNLTGNNLEDLNSTDKIVFAIAGQRLLLANNLIRGISETFCSQCCTIKGLNLSHNNISLLPDGISFLTRLSYLFLENNLLCLLPYSIGKMTGLKELNLQDNFLTILPSSLGLCTQLSSMNLYGNPLTMFPDGTKLWNLPLAHMFDYLDDYLITPTTYEGKDVSELKLSKMQLKHIPLNVMTTKEVIKYVQNESEKMIPQRIAARVSQGVRSRSALANHFGQGSLLSKKFLRKFSQARSDSDRTVALELLKKEESLDVFGRPLDLVDRAIKTGSYITTGIEMVAARYKEAAVSDEVMDMKAAMLAFATKFEDAKAAAKELEEGETIDAELLDDKQDEDASSKLTAKQKKSLEDNLMKKVGQSVSDMALRRISGQMSDSNVSEQDSIGTLVYDFDILHLDHNELPNLPKIIYRCYNTSVMNFQYNLIASIGREFKYLSTLTHLRMDGNQINSISTEITCLTRLQILNLKRNNIQYNTLNSISWDKLVGLTELDFSENSISSEHRFLPEQMYRIPNLHVLRLQKCWLRRNPDSEVRYLTQLQELDVSYNLFFRLCYEFRHLRHCLKKLDCEMTPIVFPEFDIIASAPASSVCKLLQQMWLAKNNGILFVQRAELPLLPVTILEWGTVDPLYFLANSGTDEYKSSLNLDVVKHQVTKLQKLRAAVVLILLAQTEIKKMGSISGFHLKQLNLVGNKIKILPAQICKLIFLEDFDISENCLTLMDPNIGMLARLAYLNVSHNMLLELPNELCNNYSLIDFRCTHNEVSYIPFKMGGLEVLKWLDASSNQMSFPPQTIISQGPLSVVEFMKSCYSEFVRKNSLSLNNRNLIDAPPGLFKVENLLAIDLSNNEIETLSSRIDSATFLQSLNAINNHLTAVPASIGFLTDLTSLQLSNNRMRALPPTMVKCSKLRILDIRKNAFKTIPTFVFRAFAHLQELWYSDNEIHVIDVPAPTPNLRQLRSLKSAGNCVREFFQPYFFLIAITDLDFSGNSLRELPNELANLHNLVTLNLSRNKLKCLSKNIGALTCLAQMLLHCNQLNQLSASFIQLQGLQLLKLHDNPLKVCPLEIRYITGLTRLTLSGCSLTKFNEAFRGECLNLLTMSNNDFSLLPTNIMNMHALQTLAFNSNALVELPPTMHHMTSLTELWLSDNRISVVHEALYQMSQLVILALNGNNIASMSMSLGSLVNLEELYLHNNKVYELPNTIVVLQKLQILNLAGNVLETLPQARLPPPSHP